MAFQNQFNLAEWRNGPPRLASQTLLSSRREAGRRKHNMHYTYILKSVKFIKYYTGYTDNLENRLEKHNNGKSLYSSRYKPWRIIYFEEFASKNDAIKREKYFKSATGRRWLKKNV